MKTVELEGAALDWAVAKCEEYVAEFVHSQHRNQSWVVCDTHQDCHPPISDPWGGQWQMFAPSTDWAQAGPIIEREKMELVPHFMYWDAYADEGTHIPYSGPTPLIAAMRCYVASKLGDEIELPEGLK